MAALKEKQVKRIPYSSSWKQGKTWISSGDMKEKLDPYMQPL
jgi:hypothetical protein